MIVVLADRDRDPEGWGEGIDTEPLAGDLSHLTDEEVAMRLAVLLSQVSEDCYCASWMISIGQETLEWLKAGEVPYFHRNRWLDVVYGAEFSPLLIGTLQRARDRLGGRWLDWEHGSGVVLKPMVQA